MSCMSKICCGGPDKHRIAWPNCNLNTTRELTCLLQSLNIRKVAHPSVRNIGTIGGNLMLKHAYQDFPSDLFLLMETIGAKLIIKSPGLVHVITKQFLPPNLLVRFTGTFYVQEFLLIKLTGAFHGKKIQQYLGTSINDVRQFLMTFPPPT